MEGNSPIKKIYSLLWASLGVSLYLIIFLQGTEGGYMITTPRKWVSEENSQVCITLDQLASPEDSLSIRITSDGGNTTVLEDHKFPIVAGERSQCHNIRLPDTKERTLQMELTGSLTGSTVNHTHDVGIASNVHETYVQTDKFLYKPSQTVRFRILSVSGPMLQLETGQYSEIWVENPSGSRISQWLNASNPNGLIHLEFQLTEEPEEGTYNIKVKTPFGTTASVQFKVEEYVLPRFEVIITPPNYVLGTTKSVPFTICAKYTFGQPVKGQLRFHANNNGWGSYRRDVKKNATISGCETVNILETDINLNDKDYYTYSIKANAEVEEEGTGVILKASESNVDISRTAVSFEDVSVQEFLKPELPYLAEIKTTFPDKSPAKAEPMEVCYGDGHGEDTCKKYTTDENGLLTFLVPPHVTSSMNVKASSYPRIKDGESWRSIMYESTFYKNFKKYHSPSNSSIILFLTEKKLACVPGKTLELSLPIKFSAVNQTEAHVSVQVVSRGQVQFSSTSLIELTPDTAPPTPLQESLFLEPMKPSVTVNSVRGEFVIPITLPETVSPEAKIVVWYIRDDGEVVSDYRDVDIGDCLPHSASLTWSTGKTTLPKPGDSATLTLKALPDSLCSLGVVDKSVELLSSTSNKLTVSNLLSLANRGAASQYEYSQVNDYEYCKKQEDEKTTVAPPTGGIPPIEPPVALPVEVAEEEVPIRKRRSSPPWGGRPYFSYSSDDVDAIHGFDKSGLFVFTDLTLETRPCNKGHDSRPVAFGGGIQYFRPPRPRPHPSATQRPVVATSTVPSLEVEGVKEEETTSRTYFPETWLWDLKSVDATGTNEEILELPDTVTEWVGRAVCVHPTGGVGLTGPSSITTFRDFFADLTLPTSVKRGEIFPVKISVFNYLKDSLPVKVELHSSTEYEILSAEGVVLTTGEQVLCIAAEDKDVVEIRIRPTVFGEVNITVGAYVDINTVDTCGGKPVEFDSSRSDLLVKPVTVNIEGFEKEITQSKYICMADIVDLSDALEQWELAPPADIVEDSARGWVNVVGDLMGPTIENLGKLVKMPYGCGEQNMLNFAPNIFVMQYLDASNQNTEEIAGNALKYMKKGYQRELNYRHDDGSFSAFGKSDDSGSTWLTAFVLKSFAQARPYISVDEKDLELSGGFLKGLQQENGCFDSVGKVLHKGMKGGVDKSESKSLLTAFVLIALMEAGETPASKVVTDAEFCLVAEPLTADDPYALAVRTYALSLTGHASASDGIDALLAAATPKGATLYWDLPKNLESGKGVAVETAGYAVLALLTQDPALNSVHARKVIKWMNNQRNGQGGFVSTQDTIVALQAMALFEKELPQGPVDLLVQVDAGGPLPKFLVDDNNKLLLQQRDIPAFPVTVEVSMEGTGCALVQATLRYNVPNPDPSDGFDVNITTTTPYDMSCKTKNIDACASYTLADKLSNMAIIEVNLISGYIPEKKDLKRIVGDGTGNVKRYEVDGSKVTFYFDELSETGTCVNFNVLREVQVETPKPGTVVVYDYYKPELSISKSYTLPDPSECVSVPPPPPTFESEILPFPLEELQPVGFPGPEGPEVLVGPDGPEGPVGVEFPEPILLVEPEPPTTLSPAENIDGLLDAIDEMP